MFFRQIVTISGLLVALTTCSQGAPDGEARGVVRETPIVAGTETIAAAQPGKKRALVIGIDNYFFMRKLQSAQKDARAFAGFLKAAWGFPAEYVTLVTDADAPSNAVLTWKIQAFVESLRPDDQVVFFFSGHGNSDGKNDFLFPFDANGKNLEATCYSYNQLRSEIERKTPRQVLLITDACRDLSDNKTGGTISNFGVSDPIMDRDGFIEFRSCRSGQSSLERTELDNGVFTYFLLQGLNGAPKALDNGVITFDSLRQFVTRETSVYAMQKGGKQEPFATSSSGNIVIGSIVTRLLPVDAASANQGVVTAMRRGNYQDVRKWILAGADNWDYHQDETPVEFQNLTPPAEGMTPLLWASAKNDTECLTLLRDRGSNLNASNGGRGPTALHMAARYDAAKAAEFLLAGGASLQPDDGEGNTPLHLAAAANAANVTRLLLKNGADPKKKIPYGQTPLDLAVKYHAPLTVKLLIETGGWKRDMLFDFSGPIRTAIQDGNAEIFGLLLPAVDLEENGGELINMASAAETILPVLVKAGVDIEEKGTYGLTPLQAAVMMDQFIIAKNLLDNGAKTETCDWSGTTLLMQAVTHGSDKMVKLLLEHKADPNARNKENNTPLKFARVANKSKIVELLQKFGAKE